MLTACSASTSGSLANWGGPVGRSSMAKRSLVLASILLLCTIDKAEVSASDFASRSARARSRSAIISWSPPDKASARAGPPKSAPAARQQAAASRSLHCTALTSDRPESSMRLRSHANSSNSSCDSSSSSRTSAGTSFVDSDASSVDAADTPPPSASLVGSDASILEAVDTAEPSASFVDAFTAGAASRHLMMPFRKRRFSKSFSPKMDSNSDKSSGSTNISSTVKAPHSLSKSRASGSNLSRLADSMKAVRPTTSSSSSCPFSSSAITATAGLPCNGQLRVPPPTPRGLTGTPQPVLPRT
mmetsp:Transcript_8041/g.16960  ORF Transcript_8041/g.16960 Transcript_8041/m.16960 type:complete len:301 (+) Transcript_8041:161-1063(+)